jgi:hypothetical protein
MKIPARAQCAMTIVPARARKLDKVELRAAVRSHTWIPIAGSAHAYKCNSSSVFTLALFMAETSRIVPSTLFS